MDSRYRCHLLSGWSLDGTKLNALSSFNLCKIGLSLPHFQFGTRKLRRELSRSHAWMWREEGCFLIFVPVYTTPVSANFECFQSHAKNRQGSTMTWGREEKPEEEQRNRDASGPTDRKRKDLSISAYQQEGRKQQRPECEDGTGHAEVRAFPAWLD